MTNGDKIRKMSDDEMAKFIAYEVPHGDCYGCDMRCIDSTGNIVGCELSWKDWLKQESDE